MPSRLVFPQRRRSRSGPAGDDDAIGQRGKSGKLKFSAIMGAFRERRWGSNDGSTGEGQDEETDGRDLDGAGRYGMMDFRSFHRWRFAAHPFFRTEEKSKTSIGTLHVTVVEAKGLMAADVNGKSDPFIKLDLTGRYISNEQEWSESLRVHERTKVIKTTLDPRWNEKCSLPVRRAGAVLKVGVWDWDRRRADDPLGHFEIQVGEELLSQQEMDMWFVLEAPQGFELAAAVVSAAKNKRGKITSVKLDGEGAVKPPDVLRERGSGRHETKDEDTADAVDMSVAVSSDSEGQDSLSRTDEIRAGFYAGAFSLTRSSKVALLKRNLAPPDHSHRSNEEARACEACIELRRKTFGEVRLRLRYEFNDFAETMSHIWPEEPQKPPETVFSPNRVYFRAMLLWELAQPYVICVQKANDIVCWIRPWKSLWWLTVTSVMLLFPSILIVVVNAALIWVATSGHLKARAALAADGKASSTGSESDFAGYGPRNRELSDVFQDSSSTAGDAPMVTSSSAPDRVQTGKEGTSSEITSSVGPGVSTADTKVGTSSTSATMGATVTVEAPSSTITSKDPSQEGGKKKAKTKKKVKFKIRGRNPGKAPTPTGGDPEMEELYARLQKASKLPGVVQEVGRRLFAKDGQFAQRQVEMAGNELMLVRRRFCPAHRRQHVQIVFALVLHTFLQLWLYRTSRFNIYFLLICAGIFCFKFYRRRGRAFLLAVKEAYRCRQVRRSHSTSTPPPTPYQTLTSSPWAPGPLPLAMVSDGSSGGSKNGSRMSMGGVRISMNTDSVMVASGQRANGNEAPPCPAFGPPGTRPVTQLASAASTFFEADENQDAIYEGERGRSHLTEAPPSLSPVLSRAATYTPRGGTMRGNRERSSSESNKTSRAATVFSRNAVTSVASLLPPPASATRARSTSTTIQAQQHSGEGNPRDGPRPLKPDVVFRGSSPEPEENSSLRVGSAPILADYGSVRKSEATSVEGAETHGGAGITREEGQDDDGDHAGRRSHHEWKATLRRLTGRERRGGYDDVAEAEEDNDSSSSTSSREDPGSIRDRVRRWRHR